MNDGRGWRKSEEYGGGGGLTRVSLLKRPLPQKYKFLNWLSCLKDQSKINKMSFIFLFIYSKEHLKLTLFLITTS